MSRGRRASTLGELLGAAVPPDLRPVEVTNLSLDSREVGPGGLFCACRGSRGHGLDYVDQALAAGAAAVAWEGEGDDQPARFADEAAVFPVRDLRARLGTVASLFFGQPSGALQVVGVTGTNGKSTCACLFAAAMERLGVRCGLIGTLGMGYPGALDAGQLTTPDVISVHRRLADFRADGATTVAMEVSSHALAQGRVDGVRFHTTAFTNLSREHLDYHGSMTAYGEAKSALFRRADVKTAVINVGDPFGRKLRRSLPVGVEAIDVAVVPDGIDEAKRFIVADEVLHGRTGLRLGLRSSWGDARLSSGLIGRFNAENLLVVLGMLLASDVAMGDALDAIAGLSAPPGRMEAFGGDGDQPLVIVDFAHTPDALAVALEAAREHCAGTLYCVFGAGGDRDPGKRPLMGAAAARLADRLVLTDDNPRGESPEAIVAAIRAGIDAGRATEVIHDRAAAIRAGVSAAGAGDVVLVAGKGHENIQEIGAQRIPFCDREVVRQCLGRAT